jgi:hypothetical protein
VLSSRDWSVLGSSKRFEVPADNHQCRIHPNTFVGPLKDQCPHAKVFDSAQAQAPQRDHLAAVIGAVDQVGFD